MKRYSKLRWVLLAAGVIAILGLTGMNVYSLYQLHESTIETDQEPKKLQVAEFADRVRYRFFKPFWGLSSTSIEKLQSHFEKTNQFTEEVATRVQEAAEDSIFTDVYFIPANTEACQQNRFGYKYNKTHKQLIPSSNISDIVCDGMGIARTQMRALINDYRYNNKVTFDTNRSVTVVLVNPSEKTIFGYVTMPINQTYLTERFLEKELQKRFGPPEESGMNVWMRDWTNNNIIASSNEQANYDHNKIQFKQRFPDFFDNWNLEVSFTGSSTIEASNASLTRNLIVLIAGVLLLLGALVFMFISAQRERALAERQASFLANVTHELKTPLTVMQAAGENLSDGRVQDQERLKSYGNHIFEEAVRLRKMIEKLLDVAKADAGQSLIEPKPVYLDKLVQNYLDDHEEFIRDKDFTLEVNIDNDIPKTMLDENSFNTILGNLVENALKYSTEERHLGIYLGASDKEITLQIADHGIGMTKKTINHIFDKFYRAEDTLTAETKGHGLGLSIVQNLVELNGGTIKVDSTPGQGSTFTVTFPVLTDMPSDDTDKPTEPTSNKRSIPLTQQSENYVS